MIAQEMTKSLFQYLYITVTDTSDAGNIAARHFYEECEGFASEDTMLHRNRYMQMQPDEGVYYDRPAKSKRFSNSLERTADLETSRIYIEQ